MDQYLQDQAIHAALNQDWETAISLNLTYLKSHPGHIPTLNRLAKAYKENGCLKEAAATYQAVLDLDKYNVIAKKNLEVLIKTPPDQLKRKCAAKINPEFINEPGKAKTFYLTRLGDPRIIANLLPGQIVHLIPKKHTLCLATDSHEHIGALTDDIAFELKQYLVQGVQLEVVVRSATATGVIVFVRETNGSRDTSLQILS